MAKKLSWVDLIDFSDDAQVKQALKDLKSFLKIYDKLIATTKKGANQITANNKKIAESVRALIKDVKKLDETNKEEAKTIQQTNASAKALSDTYNAQAKQIKALETQVKKLTTERKAVSKATNEANNINKEAIKLEAQLGKLTGQNAKENAALKLQIQEKRKALAAEAKVAAGRVTLYQKESALLNKLRNDYKNVALAQGQNSAAAKKLLNQITPLDNKLKQLDATVGQGQRSVGLYGKSLLGVTRQIAGALGFTSAIFLMIGAIKSAFNTIRTFQKGNAVLAGVLNKSRSEITELTEDSKRLGAITAKSATEVNKLQIAYARLGFTQAEILDLTEDTINGSIALNAELDETAELTGAMVRTFGELKTTDAGSILDRLTLATQKSALTFGKLQTALPIVAGAANAAGVSFNRTVSLLGKLSDAGIDASSSSTALRNIFIEAAAQGLSYEQILIKISESQDKLTAANDQFGKRAAVSASILANLVDEVGEFDEALSNAGGTAKKVAEEQLDTLNGKIILLSSAWEGLILSIESGDGAISSAFATITEGITNQLKLITSFNEGIINFGELVAASTDLNVRGFVLQKIALKELGDEVDRNNRKQEESAKQAEILRDAVLQYDTAIKGGVKTFAEFIEIHGDFFDETERDKALLTELEKLFNNYAAAVKEAATELSAFAKAGAKAAEALARIIESEKQLFDDTIDISKAKVDAVISEEERRVQETIDLMIAESLAAANIDKKASEDEIKLAEETAAKKQLIREVAFDSASIIGNQLFINNQIRLENELSDLQSQKNFELELAGDSAEKRAQIEKKFADQERRIKIKQAKATKKQALFNVTIHTAEAIAKTAAELGFPAAIPFIIAAGVSGAVQTAAILSQPLPAFEHGGMVETDGRITTSEKGREMYVDRHGKLGMTGNSGSETRSGMKGSYILPNPVTESLISNGFDHKSINDDSSNRIQTALIQERDRQTNKLVIENRKETDLMMKVFKDTVGSIQTTQISIRRGEMVKDMKKGNTTIRDWEDKNSY